MTPYQYTYQNPIRYIDPTGMSAEDADGVEWTGVEKNKDGTYTVVAGQADNDKGIYVMENGKRTGETIGKSFTEYSFHEEDGSAVVGAIINPNDTSGINFMNNEIINNQDLTLDGYMKNATGGGIYDFKRRDENGAPLSNNDPRFGDRPYHYRGMLFQGVDGFPEDGTTTFASARDFGNASAGYVAGRRGIPWKAARTAFDGLQTAQDNNWRTGRWQVEGQPTQRAERAGHNVGIREFKEKQVQPAIISFPSFRY